MHPSNGGLSNNQDPNFKLTQIPFILIYIVWYFLVHSIIPHKEVRFLTTLILLGSIMQAYFFRNLQDIYVSIGQFILKLIKNHVGNWLYVVGVPIYQLIGRIFKLVFLYVIFRQEIARIHKMCVLCPTKYDSTLEIYNTFSQRNENFLEQPESIYFVDKFM